MWASRPAEPTITKPSATHPGDNRMLPTRNTVTEQAPLLHVEGSRAVDVGDVADELHARTVRGEVPLDEVGHLRGRSVGGEGDDQRHHQVPCRTPAHNELPQNHV